LKNKERSNGRRAFSPVIAAIILSAVVIAIGGAVWAFSQGTMTIIAEDYAESVINMTDTISERFIVEHVAYTRPNLRVWIFNYGNVDIEVKIEVGGVIHPQNWIKMMAGGFKEVVPTLSYPTAVDGKELVIRAYTKRGNNAYYRYLVPIVP
jgi:flagellin-like protein